MKVLEDLGLSKNEAKTYLALLKLGSVPAGPLIKVLGMHRAAVYDLLDILIDKGLVHYVIQSNRKYFEAQDPRRLFELIDHKKKKLNEQEKKLKEVLPELKLKRKLSKEKQESTIYKGKKGLKSIFEDILISKTSELKVMGAGGRFKEIFHAYFIHWHERRVKKKVALKIIYSESLYGKRDLKLAKIRYVPDINIVASTTLVYSDKVCIIVWSDEPMAFLVRSKNVSDSYISFFDLVWKNAKV